MTEIFQKRGSWCYRDEAGRIHKFDTESEAKSSLGLETVKDAKKEVETKSSKKEASTDEQKTVRSSKSSDKKKVQSIPFGLR
mgnify:CR=1 FL=1